MAPRSDRFQWHRKFRDAGIGLVVAVRYHNSFHVHFLMALLVVALALLLKLQPWQWCALILSIGGVMTAELFNTAMEELVRVIHPGIDPRIRRVLDIAAAAVLLASITAAVVGLIVLLPALLS